MAEVSDAAQRVADALRLGDLEQAQTLMQTFPQELASPVSSEELRKTLAIILEARNMAQVHRSQTIASMRELVRSHLYDPEAPTMTAIFELDA